MSGSGTVAPSMDLRPHWKLDMDSLSLTEQCQKTQTRNHIEMISLFRMISAPCSSSWQECGIPKIII
jgi:hypothetical protein